MNCRIRCERSIDQINNNFKISKLFKKRFKKISVFFKKAQKKRVEQVKNKKTLKNNDADNKFQLKTIRKFKAILKFVKNA